MAKFFIVCNINFPFLLDFRHADSVLQDELKQNGVPINQINESDGDEEYLGHDIKGM